MKSKLGGLLLMLGAVLCLMAFRGQAVSHSPQPKQLNRSGTPPTDRDGVVSSWNGQQPMYPRPRGWSCTPEAAMTCSIGCAARSAAMSMRSWPVVVMAGSRSRHSAPGALP